MRRRSFLAGVTGITALGFGRRLPQFWINAALAAAQQGADNGRVVVVVQMSGGNDSLNTVIPYKDYRYHEARPTLSTVARNAIRLDDRLALHPELQDLADCIDRGWLSIVHGLGYPNNSREHQQAMREWHTARPGDANCKTGWLGRVLDAVCDPSTPAVPAVCVAPGVRPIAVNGLRVFVPTFGSVEELRLQTVCQSDTAAELARDIRRLCDALPPSSNPLLDVAAKNTRAMTLGVERIAAAVERFGLPTGYPATPFGRQLALVHSLLRADVGIRVFFTVIGGPPPGGFDNHANQLGNHGALLSQLSRSIGVFARKLEADYLLDRVLLFTFSEFGRTLHENGRHGTGHGAAASHFLLCKAVRRRMIGTHPPLDQLEQDALRPSQDFRSLYAAVLQQWLEVDPRPAVGERFPPLQLL